MYRLVQDQRIFMNTIVEISAWTDLDRSLVYELFDKAYQQFHFVIDRFSRFKNDSELSRLNEKTGEEVKVSQELFNLITFALEIAKKTNGAFDPTVIDFLETYGYNAHYDFKRLSHKELLKREIQQILKERPSFKEIQINRKDLSIRLAKTQRIDLGSLGKGYAIDLAYRKLLPLKNYVINAGGDIRARGSGKGNKPWLVGLKVPGCKPIGVTFLTNEALCCSGGWARKVQFFHHLINPKTGEPENYYQATFVRAKTAIEADAWATALFVLGKKAPEIIQKYNIRALLFTHSGGQLPYNFSYTC